MPLQNKSRILFLLSYLNQYTDEKHSLSTNEIVKVLEAHGFKANRRTVKDDMDALIAAGYDVIAQHSTATYYYMGDRVLELPEIKLLIDAVSSSRFISQKKSDALIAKLSAIAGEYQAQSLSAHIFTSSQVKADNDFIYYIVDVITRAIDEKKKIQFQYFDFAANKRKVLRNNGEIYINSPYALLWHEDNYYLLGYSDKHSRLVTFRVDRISKPVILEENCVQAPEDFDAVEYAQQNFHMYGGEETRRIVLECRNSLMKCIIDQFGCEAKTWKSSNNTFRVQIEVHPEDPFYGWVFQFGGQMRIVDPPDIVGEYREMAKRVAENL